MGFLDILSSLLPSDWEAHTWGGFAILYGIILFFVWGLGSSSGFLGVTMQYKLIFTFGTPFIIMFFINRQRS